MQQGFTNCSNNLSYLSFSTAYRKHFQPLYKPRQPRTERCSRVANTNGIILVFPSMPNAVGALENILIYYSSPLLMPTI